MLSEQVHKKLGMGHSQDSWPKEYSIQQCQAQYINWEGLVTATALCTSFLSWVLFFWFCCLPFHYNYCYIILLFNFISIIKLFLSQPRSFTFFSDSPPYPSKGGTSRCVALSCLSVVKKRSSRQTFHVTQASGPPWWERCLVPEGASCARDDLLWPKECAVTYRSRQSPMHITHMVDTCICGALSSCANSLALMTWRDEEVPMVHEAAC